MLVFHVDVNSAYLSWTAADLIEKGYGMDIRNMPAVISGNPENRHGIILAKSIAAKKFGIKTGESLFEAKQKCPELKVFAPDYDLYLSCSEAMYEMLYEYTPLIQRYSIDECFCDMTACKKAMGNPIAAAYEIKERIKKELGFTVNIGIGENKLCAKMAGELKKPDLIHTMWKYEIPKKLWPLPARELFMVGRATEKKLQKFNINTIGDIAKASPVWLKTVLKSHGLLIHNYANGVDNEPVTVNEEIQRKGLGNGLTYTYDLLTREEIDTELLALCERVGERLRRYGKVAGLVRVHIRSSNLNGYSHQIKLAGTIETTDEIYVIAKQLIDEMWKGEPVRAMSVSLSDLYGHNQVQLSMFDRKNKERNEKLDKVVDEIRKLFGDDSIFRGRFANTEISPIQGGVNDGDYIMMGGFKQ